MSPRATAKCAGRLGYSVAREYTGHGVGRAMHEEPRVPNWWHSKNSRYQWQDYDLQEGMTYAIEPMLIAGRARSRGVGRRLDRCYERWLAHGALRAYGRDHCGQAAHLDPALEVVRIERH